LTAALNDDMNLIEAWADSKDLTIAPNKLSVTLFISDPAQHKHHLQVFYKAVLHPINMHVRALGFNLDPKVMLNIHSNIQASSGPKRNNIMKAVSGNSWGQKKETLLTTFKMLVRPVIEYNPAVWQPLVNPTSVEKLQKVQNAGLRIVTGCHKKASIDHLHAETEMLTVNKHIDLLSLQFLVIALQPDHPSHSVVTPPWGPRTKKHTLYSKNIQAVHV
jgi:hypothetical protein